MERICDSILVLLVLVLCRWRSLPSPAVARPRATARRRSDAPRHSRRPPPRPTRPTTTMRLRPARARFRRRSTCRRRCRCRGTGDFPPDASVQRGICRDDSFGTQLSNLFGLDDGANIGLEYRFGVMRHLEAIVLRTSIGRRFSSPASTTPGIRARRCRSSISAHRVDRGRQQLPQHRERAERTTRRRSAS